MKTQTIAKTILFSVVLLLTTAPVFAQRADLAKILTEGIVKQNITEAVASQMQHDLQLLAVRSTELYAEQAARFTNASVGPIENEQLWPDYRELQTMLHEYSVLLAAGKTKTYREYPELPMLNLAFVPTEQHLLSRINQEAAAFSQEIRTASHLWADLQRAKLSNTLFTPEGKEQFAARFDKIPNPTLRRDLSQALQEENFPVLDRDLREYYSLGMDDAAAALQYAMHHSHGRNLALRRLLVSPFVNQNYKAVIKRFLSHRQIEEANVTDFVDILVKAFQGQQGLKAFLSQSSPVQTKIRNLDSFINRFDSFVKENGRVPDAQTADEVEHNLALEYDTFLWERKYNTAEPFVSFYNTYDALAQKYGLTRR